MATLITRCYACTKMQEPALCLPPRGVFVPASATSVFCRKAVASVTLRFCRDLHTAGCYPGFLRASVPRLKAMCNLVGSEVSSSADEVISTLDSTARVTVREVMSREVVCLKDSMTVSEAIQVFLRQGISGAPVLDEGGCLVGVLSETDIILEESEAERQQHIDRNIAFQYLPFLQVSDFPITSHNVHKVRSFLQLCVRDVMSSTPLTCRPDMLMIEAVAMMTGGQVQRLPVVEGGEVVGILSKGNVMQYMIWAMLVASNGGADGGVA